MKGNAMNNEPTNIIEPDGTEILQATPPPMEMAGGQIENLIRVAHEYPRSIQGFIDNATELACLDEETAASCFYSKPQAGGTITGPSVKLAQIVASCWKNLWVQCSPVAEDKRFVTVRATAWDLESNLCISFDVKRQITNRNGDTYADHMIATTTSAAASVAYRNAVLRLIPEALTRKITHQINSVIRGEERTLDERRGMMVQWFAAQGVDAARICANLEVDAVVDIGLDEFQILSGIRQSMKDGLPVDQIFPRSSTGENLSPRQALHLRAQSASEAVKNRIKDGLGGNDEQERDPDTNQIIPDHIGKGAQA